MSIFENWPGSCVVLIWGNESFKALQRSATQFERIQQDCVYGVFVNSRTTKKKKGFRYDLKVLYGGVPVLVINAMHFTYSEMSKLRTDILGETRHVYVTPDFPYWHHSFKVEEHPCGFAIEKDQAALDSLCSQCLCQYTCILTKKACHTICDACARADFEMTCYHASHKREHIEFEDAALFDGLTDLSVGYCLREGCPEIIDSSIVCFNCNVGGYCSELCLRLNHDC